MTENPAIDLTRLPDWHREPSVPLASFGTQIADIEVRTSDRKVLLLSDAQEWRIYPEQERQRRIEQGKADTLRPGNMANVESVVIQDGVIRLETNITDFFDYLASAYAFRNNQGASNILPLAAQATFFTASGLLVVDKRSDKMTDFPGAYSQFGGSLTPERAADPEKSLREIARQKWQLDLAEDQLHKTGLDIETINRILCLFFTSQLQESQSSNFQEVLERRKGGEQFILLSPDRQSQQWENFIADNWIQKWNPTALTNTLYALVYMGYRTPQEAENIVEDQKQRLHPAPFDYTYPMENYLPPGL